jgi:hypothetical protein
VGAGATAAAVRQNNLQLLTVRLDSLGAENVEELLR